MGKPTTDGEADRFGAPFLRHWRHVVRLLTKRLARVYGSPMHGNLANPTDELFYILLTKKTPPSRYLPVYKILRNRFKSWDQMCRANVSTVAKVLHPLGMSVVRARQFGAIARKLKRDFGAVTLSPLRKMSCEDARRYLLGLPGVGEKSARCILMYSLGHDISPMDTHATRVLARFGLLPQMVTPRVAHQIMDERLPRRMAKSLHVNVVAHGRAVCRARRPLCSVCILNDVCPKVGVN